MFWCLYSMALSVRPGSYGARARRCPALLYFVPSSSFWSISK